MQENREKDLKVFITNTTKTVDVMDKFEGYDEKKTGPYGRIVLENSYIVYVKNYVITYHLIIERYGDKNKDVKAVGDITFSEFKGKKSPEVYAHADEQIAKAVKKNPKVLEQKEIHFDEAYYLRAQNQGNREGYGWEWDWSNGVGDYWEGTNYGETDDYCFTGVVVELVQSLEEVRKNNSAAIVDEYPKYEGVVTYKRTKFYKIYFSETEAVLIERPQEMDNKRMWKIFQDFMQSRKH